MLMPKKVKYRKVQKGRVKGDATRGHELAFGDFGLKALEHSWMTNRQIEAARIAMTRHVKRGGKIWIRVFPDRPTTSKPAETRMGKGKGDPQGYCVQVRPGRVIFELDGIPEAGAREALRKAGTKLPVKIRIVSREV